MIWREYDGNPPVIYATFDYRRLLHRIIPLVESKSLLWSFHDFFRGKSSISMGHLYYGYVSLLEVILHHYPQWGSFLWPRIVGIVLVNVGDFIPLQ